jgi:hypothetical protein
MKIEPYTAAELEAVLAFKMPQSPVKGRCDWCGGEYTGRPSGPHICARCVGNRDRIHDALALVPVGERDADDVHDDVLPDGSPDNTRRGRSA